MGNPHMVSGENATVVITVPSKYLITSVDELQLLDTDGAVLSRLTTFTLIEGRANISYYRVQFPLPTQVCCVVNSYTVVNYGCY